LIPTQALEFVRRAAERFPALRMVVLYGSFPKGDYDDRSDVDLLLLFGERGAERKYLSWAVALGNEVIKKLEDSGEKTWDFQFLIVEDVKRLDRSLRAAIASEGVVLYGEPRGLLKGPRAFALFEYRTSGLSGSERVAFYRALRARGLLESKLGPCLLVSSRDAGEVEKLLARYGILKRRYTVFME
jgi:predicted nucleotidyltransferase